MLSSPFLLCLLIVTIYTKTVHSSIPFIMNPGCDIPECNITGNPAIFYANHFVGDETIHILYSSFDELTISLIQTKKGYGPHINYAALFNKNYPDSISFGDTTPLNSFSLILRRLIQFNDKDNTGKLDVNDNSTRSYWLKGLQPNITFQNDTITEPSLQLPIKDINGLLTVDVIYPGEITRDSKFPKLRSTLKSYFLNIAFKADEYTLPHTRFAFEFYIIQLGVEGIQLSSSKYIDDQYTPGIFNVWQMKSLSPLYTTSMLWKPVVYQSEDRSIEKNTLMQVYDLKSNVLLQPSIDQGIFNALYNKPYVSAFNISLGRANDGFFTKSNYTFVQFTVGLDTIETDSIKQFVAFALLLSLALPTLVAFIAILVIIKRRCTKPNQSSYDAIED